MVKFLLLYLLLTLNYQLNAQFFPKASPDSVLVKIELIKSILDEKLVDSIGLDSMNRLVGELKEYTDALYYTTKWNISLEEPDWDKRVFLLREISLYPYYLVKNKDLIQNASTLYEGAFFRLIKEYEGNVDLLNSISVVPAYSQRIYPTLKRAIERAGGTWSKGPLDNYYYDP